MAANRPTAEIDPAVLDVLRLACHQLLSMRVAQHAAVNEAVSLARGVGSRSATGFVNGVLRTITRSTSDEWMERVLVEATTDDDRLAARFSHPTWIIRAFRQALAAEGRDSELEQLLASDNAAPRVTLATLPGQGSDDDSREQPTRYSPVGSVVSGDPAPDPCRSGRASSRAG